MYNKCVPLLYLLLYCHTLMAQGLFENTLYEDQKPVESFANSPLKGYIRGSAWGGAQRYDYSNVFGEFALQAKFSGEKSFFSGELRVIEGYFFDEHKSILRLKEAYGGYTGKKLDLFAGNQIVSWGRTDGFNPVNNINPVDYFFLTPDPDDQILSTFMIRSKFRFSFQTELETLIIPVYNPSIYRYNLFDMGENAVFNNAVLPSSKFSNSSFAARIKTELPSIGFSLSWFSGYDPFYGFRTESIQLFPVTEITYQPDFYKKNTIGGDFELPVKKWILRMEAAVNITDNYKNNMHIPNPDLYYVTGIEHNFRGCMAILQYIGRYTFDFRALEIPVLADPFNQQSQLQYAEEMILYESSLFNRKIFHQQKERNHAFMISLNRSFAYETVRTELSLYYNITSDEYIIRPTLSWNISDDLAAFLGVSLMKGPENSIFDKAGDVLNGLFAGMKYSF